MESSDAETGMVDCGVGTIVWVRRRNGSWWPGKILGPDELSASHLMSPRSGTPVKLLGREDASVDWYNLEKSKRVKPFRCGEFDDCIERAEASQGMPPKKREKYARREDAILHALELEKQLLEKKYGKLGVQSNGLSNKLLGNVGKDTTVTPEFSCDNGKHVNSKMDLSLEDKRKGLPLQAQRVDSGSQLNVDDKSPDLRPRVRGLQDLGVGPIPSKYKLSALVASNGSHKHVVDDGVSADLHGLTPENRIPVGSKSLLEKRKRSQEGNTEESIGKRRDRRRPLVQVLQSSAKLPRIHPLQLQDDGGSATPLVGEEQREAVDPPAIGGNDPGMTVKSGDSFDYREILPDHVEISTPKSEKRDDSFPVGLNEENTTGSNEDTETDSSGTESLISDTYDAMAALSDEAEHIEFIPKAFGRSEAQGEHESMSDDSGLPDDSGDSLQTSVTVSKWQLKGKRNSRSLTKRYPNVSERKASMSSSHWVSFKGEDMYGVDGADSFDRNLRNQAIGHRRRDLDCSHDIINWEELTRNDQPCLKGYWEQSGEYHDSVYVSRQFGGRMKSMLIDVDVEVQSGYQREHVPMISLMSKLNEKAIVGHPIPIETLEDGSSDLILSAADELFGTESLGYDTTLQPWRTARRTAKCRVPRLSTLEEEERHDYVDEEDGKASAHKGRAGKVPKKPQRRSSSSSCSQKIRTLSSIGGSQQQSMDLKGEGEGVMKPESLPTAVACIPVKLVFSRLHEELVARHQ
ncbi:uncharacterized protein At1g51745-like isoform X1 [Cynara cardunculus var. scolymus]|uniref:uncharacterized protein At1g51745-like isoform X1 n=1 Tax=Cynara cardunculus var. scolymus TaxID=59895 RepID=UPI000D6298A6|nr:uncharacterized protein At1g51745-like isoform X1 [Cynara cardunculus var. scolymus]